MILEHKFKTENMRFLESFSNFEIDPFAVSNLGAVDFEQDCLLRLRKQREKMQEIAGKNGELQKEVNRLNKEKQQLLERVDEMEQRAIFEEKYEALKVEFERLLKSHELAQYQIEELKIELENVITNSEEEVNQLKGVIRREKQTNAMHIAHFETLITEKDEEIRKTKKESRAKEDHLHTANGLLKEQNERLRESLALQGVELQENEQMLKKQLKSKEIGLVGSEKCIQQLKRQIKTLKFQIQQLKFQHKREKDEYMQLIDQTRAGMKLIKREKDAKVNQNDQLREQMQLYESKCRALEENVATLKANMSKWKNKTEQTQAKRQQMKSLQQQKLQQNVLRLRKEIQKHVQDYNMLSIELKRAKSIIQQKDCQNRQRKSLKKM